MKFKCLFWGGVLSFSLFSCIDNTTKEQGGEVLSVNVEQKGNVCEDIVEFVDFLPLKEPVMTFSVINKMIIHNGKIFIFDRIGQNVLLSFDMKGNFITSYSTKGKSKSEYVRLFDFDVDDKYVYLYDRIKKQMLFYTHDGHFVKNESTNFYADAFKVLQNGNYLFSLGEENDEKLCLTDSMFKIKEVFLKYDSRDNSDRMVDNLFQKVNDTIYYNYPLSDIVYLFDITGKKLGSYQIDFGGKNIPDDKKLSYGNLIRTKDREHYISFRDCPLFVGSKLVASVYDRGNKAILYYDLNSGTGGVKRLAEKGMLSKDVCFPLFCDDIYVIGWLDAYLYERLSDKDKIQSEIVEHLNKGGNVLAFYRLRQ